MLLGELSLNQSFDELLQRINPKIQPAICSSILGLARTPLSARAPLPTIAPLPTTGAPLPACAPPSACASFPACASLVSPVRGTSAPGRRTLPSPAHAPKGEGLPSQN